MIELVHDVLNLLIGYILKAAAFSKVLPDQPSGVFVQSTLPGTLRVGKIDRRLQSFCDYFVTRKFFAVISGNRQGLIDKASVM